MVTAFFLFLIRLYNKFYIVGIGFLSLFECLVSCWGYWHSVLVWMLVLYWEFTHIWLPFKILKWCKKRGDGWRSRSAINFGQHYAIISADLWACDLVNPSWCHDSVVVASWNRHGTGRDLERFYYFASFRPTWVPNYYV